MSAPMVRAILSGAKTQTRRLISDPRNLIQKIGGSGDADNDPGAFGYFGEGRDFSGWMVLERGVDERVGNNQDRCSIPCPYDVDRLWVRETWRVQDASEAEIRYAADGATVRHLSSGDASFWKRWREKSHLRNGGPAWCPSIYLPRWASRLTLDVVSVQVQRLHDISEEDARAEGVTLDVGCPCQGDAEEPGEHLPLCRFSFDPWPGETPFDEPRPYARAFAALWSSINGRKSWDEDPWLWVVSFRRVAT